MKKNALKIAILILTLVALLLGYYFDHLCFYFGNRSIRDFSPTNHLAYTDSYPVIPGELYMKNHYYFYINPFGNHIMLEVENKKIMSILSYDPTPASHLDFLGIKGKDLSNLLKKAGPFFDNVMGGFYQIKYDMPDGSYYFVLIDGRNKTVFDVSLRYGTQEINILAFQVCLVLGYIIVISLTACIVIRILKKRSIITKTQSTEPPAPTE